MATPLGGEGWICCGSAAMTFDPICGDGTAHAVREAILASAAMRAVGRGEEAGPLLAHYEARLTAGFERHLGHCLQFYSSGWSGAWWREQVESAEEGIAWCRRRMEAHGRFRYRLNGLELEEIG
jgi:flavin-dependent dehydrogenase